MTLVRPGDAVYLAEPLAVASVAVWRRWRAVAVLAGPHGRPRSPAGPWRRYRITGTTVLKVNAYIR